MAENTMLRTVVVESVGEVKPRKDGKGQYQLIHLQYNGQSGKFFWDLKNNQPLDWREHKGKQYEFELQQTGKAWSASWPGAKGAPQEAGADPFAAGGQQAQGKSAPQGDYQRPKSPAEIDNINRTSALDKAVKVMLELPENAFFDEQGNINQATLQRAQILAGHFVRYIQTGVMGFAGATSDNGPPLQDDSPPPEDDDIPF